MTDACTPEEFKIEYELNGGYWPADTVSIPYYTYGTRVVINSKPKKDNYTFVAGYNAWKSALAGASGYINGANGATKEDEAFKVLCNLVLN